MEYHKMINQGMFQVENMIQTYCPHAMMVVMAVDDISSLELAEHLLLYLSHSGSIEEKAVILVANKADLVRNREIKAGAGKELAVKYNVKYIETSPGKYNYVLLGKLNKINKLKLSLILWNSLTFPVMQSSDHCYGLNSTNLVQTKILLLLLIKLFSFL
jgi:GTPase SAR1 family protein